MKKLIFIVSILALSFTHSFTQEKAKEAFQLRMNRHIAHYIQHDLDMAKARELYGHSCDKHRHITDDDIRAYAAEAEKTAFIQANMAEYMQLYFPPADTRGILTDTFICDNGGFENDFLFYRGYSTTYNNGSLLCTPKTGNTPSVYIPATLPTLREFEIATSGSDPITGIQKVKFGSKSLKLNDPYSHTNGSCSGLYGVNKLVKRFKVTEENRDFTVWYTIALENPSGHYDTQPFFSIRCDLAPYSDLCFDASILDCDSTYNQPGCTNPELMDVLDWTCHRVKLPASQIGNIATLEIVMADCGLSAHNGWAYIDGICESCTGSALGSILLTDQSPMVDGVGIDYLSCDGDIARVCGSYTDPSLCGIWHLDSISVPGFSVSNIAIDTVNKKFCFDINKDELGSGSSAEIFIAGLFKKNGGGYLPVVFSNSITLYKNLFIKKHTVEFSVGTCYSNGTADNISDDYYFAEVTINTYGSESWAITRKLKDPYPGESGLATVATGAGDQTLLVGPFLIQEGSWDLTVTIGDCVYKYTISPPPFCSGCENFYNFKIGGIECISNVTPNDWKFKIKVSGSGTGFNLKIVGGATLLTAASYNTVHTVPMGAIGYECIDFRIEDADDPNCYSKFTVCPPKPCPKDNDCNIDVALLGRECMDKEGGYIAIIAAANTGSGYFCYTTDNFSSTAPFPYDGQIGPFYGDVTVVIFTCPYADCSGCTAPACFKVMRLFQPDCESAHFGGTGLPKYSTTNDVLSVEDIKVIPNPIAQSELRIVSKFNQNSIEIYNLSGILIHKIKYSGKEYKWNMAGFPSGIYVIKYRDEKGKMHTTKFIKS